MTDTTTVLKNVLLDDGYDWEEKEDDGQFMCLRKVYLDFLINSSRVFDVTNINELNIKVFISYLEDIGYITNYSLFRRLPMRCTYHTIIDNSFEVEYEHCKDFEAAIIMFDAQVACCADCEASKQKRKRINANISHFIKQYIGDRQLSAEEQIYVTTARAKRLSC